MSETAAIPNQCAQCGTSLPDSPGGLCPRCLMAQIVQPTCVDDSVAATAPIPPEELAPLFPQLEILDSLGRGGMGVVYKALQKSAAVFISLSLLAGVAYTISRDAASPTAPGDSTYQTASADSMAAATAALEETMSLLLDAEK
jgi:hypothetical protein